MEKDDKCSVIPMHPQKCYKKVLWMKLRKDGQMEYFINKNISFSAIYNLLYGVEINRLLKALRLPVVVCNLYFFDSHTISPISIFHLMGNLCQNLNFVFNLII